MQAITSENDPLWILLKSRRVDRWFVPNKESKKEELRKRNFTLANYLSGILVNTNIWNAVTLKLSINIIRMVEKTRLDKMGIDKVAKWE